jgi:hypothetical protein
MKQYKIIRIFILRLCKILRSPKQATKIYDGLRKKFWEECIKNRSEITGLCRKFQIYSTVCCSLYFGIFISALSDFFILNFDTEIGKFFQSVLLPTKNRRNSCDQTHQ